MSNVTYEELLSRIIADGKKAAYADYHRPDQENMRDGSVKGFEDCKGKSPEELVILHGEAVERAKKARDDDEGDYWYWRCRVLEIEWTINVISAALRVRLLPYMPTGRGVMKAAEIVGIA